MNINDHMHPQQLERNSFLWSEARLVIAAVALFIGGVPPIIAYNPFPGLYGVIRPLLTLSWFISGAASAYLLYRWNTGGQRVFGGKNTHDTAAFFVSVVSGINLGLVGLLGTNIGMSIASNQLVFFVVGALYLVSAAYLWRRWKASGERVF